jgi:hypothetical protein
MLDPVLQPALLDLQLARSSFSQFLRLSLPSRDAALVLAGVSLADFCTTSIISSSV